VACSMVLSSRMRCSSGRRAPAGGTQVSAAASAASAHEGDPPLTTVP
jgi:hypothetical protein